MSCLLRRVVCILISLVVLPFVAVGQAGDQSSSSGDKPLQVHGQPPLQFTYKTVLVKYVAGTLPDDSAARGNLLGKMGCLVATRDALVFLRYDHQSFDTRAAGFMTHLLSPTWAKGRGQCKKATKAQDDESNRARESLPPTQSVPIDYDAMRALARGQVQSLSSETGSDFTLVSGIGSLAALAALKTTAGYIGLGLVSGVSIGYYVHRRTQNYITVFIRKGNGPNDGNLGACAKNKCDFVVFQVIDPHDYWNTSVLLNAMTGKAFLSEAPEQSGDSTSK